MATYSKDYLLEFGITVGGPISKQPTVYLTRGTGRYKMTCLALETELGFEPSEDISSWLTVHDCTPKRTPGTTKSTRTIYGES